MGSFSIRELLFVIIILIVFSYAIKGIIKYFKSRTVQSNKTLSPIIYVILGLILVSLLFAFLFNKYGGNNDSVQIDSTLPNPTKEQTVDEYESSIPIESMQSPLYVRYGGNCFVICRSEDNARLQTHVTDYKGYFIEDINTALDGGETKYFSREIRSYGSFVKFSFNGMSYDLTKRQCERLIYDFSHPKPYLSH